MFSPSRRGRHLAVLALCALVACDGSPTEPGVPEAILQVSPTSVELGEERQGAFTVTNAGTRAVGPVTFLDGVITGPGGTSVPTGRIVFDPAEISTVNPGDARTISVTVELPDLLPAGTYLSEIRVRSDLGTEPGGGTGDSDDDIGDESLTLRLAVAEALAEDIESVAFVDPPSEGVRGEPLELRVVALDENGDHRQGAPIVWSTVPADAGFRAEERFVPYVEGSVRVIASAGSGPDAPSDTVDLEIAGRTASGSMSLLGSARPSRNTSDLWVHGDHAYTGSWNQSTGREPGNAVFAWDVSEPANPVATDSVLVDARVVNDVKVSRDGSLAAISHEFSIDRQNGITLFDLTDPAHPEVIGRYVEGLSSGVHNVWIDGDHLYVVLDGRETGLRILDVSDPSDPVQIGSFVEESAAFLHDVYVRDGLAFLSYWDAGLIILDVGHGIAGGAPSRPVEVSRVGDLGGQTHNAWYWPEAGYVFVGEEDFLSPGVMHVVDARDLRRPREVATYRVEGETPHNFWLDEASATLYLAWYSRGVRALDVGGELMGELERQGREIAELVYSGSGSCPPLGTCTWAPQLHDGTLFLSDIDEGLVVATPVQ